MGLFEKMPMHFLFPTTSISLTTHESESVEKFHRGLPQKPGWHAEFNSSNRGT